MFYNTVGLIFLIKFLQILCFFSFKFREEATKDQVLSELSRKMEHVKKLENKINGWYKIYSFTVKQDNVQL